MEVWIAIVGLFVAAWQLNLQKKEIKKATQLEKLRIAADLIRSEIALREKIIADEKAKHNANWEVKILPHIEKVNKVLRPSLRAVIRKIIDFHGDSVEELKDLPNHYVENESRK